MPYNKPLILKPAQRKSFSAPVLLLCALALLSAISGPQAFPMTLLMIFLLGIGRFLSIICFSNVSDVELALALAADGRVRFRTAGKVAEGRLEGQQWCTRWVTVLRVVIQNKTRHLAILASQQNSKEYRRLNVLLKQNIYTCTDNRDTSGSLHSGRKQTGVS